VNKLDEKIREVFAEFGKRGGKKGMAGRTAKERKDLAKKAAGCAVGGDQEEEREEEEGGVKIRITKRKD
jgi:hypothetical protein